MGLAVTTVGVEGVKRAVTEIQPIINFTRIRLTNAYQVFYKADIDVTDWDTLCVQGDNNGASDCYLKFTLDTTLVDTITFSSGVWTPMDDSNDLSSYSGVKTVKIELKTDNAGGQALEYLMVWIKAA